MRRTHRLFTTKSRPNYSLSALPNKHHPAKTRKPENLLLLLQWSHRVSAPCQWRKSALPALQNGHHIEEILMNFNHEMNKLLESSKVRCLTRTIIRGLPNNIHPLAFFAGIISSKLNTKTPRSHDAKLQSDFSKFGRKHLAVCVRQTLSRRAACLDFQNPSRLVDFGSCYSKIVRGFVCFVCFVNIPTNPSTET